MRNRFSLSSVPSLVIQGVVFIAAAGVQMLFWSKTWEPERGAIPIALVIAGLGISTAAGWVSGLVTRIWREQQGLQHRLEQSTGQMQTLKTFLSGSLRMDTELLAATNEEQVMDVALSVIAELTGARGASFVPLDEWGQPLPARIYGRLPNAALKAWTERLTASETRQTCRACKKHEALAGEACPLMDGPFTNVAGIYCFPMQRGERILGMLNLYLPGRQALGDELSVYLKGLLNEAALAVESIRLRTRETNTLQQVQMLRAPKTDLPALLAVLLEGLQQALEVEGVQIQTRGPLSGQKPPVRMESGDTSLFELPRAEDVRAQVLSNSQPCLPGSDQAACSDGRFVGFPLRMPDRRLVGLILLASHTPLVLDERRLGILQSVADQAALLIENELEILSLEYRTVIQERARLAREIHDGLAQTLAFLKLQAAQMQVYLAQGNLIKLEQVLKQNYETLAEAYLDTRQAIDNLRMTTVQGLAAWLEQLTLEFEATSGLKVERNFASIQQELSPEIQAQVMRIVQEALNNIRKHARASQVTISLREWNGDLLLEVRDNGQGFSPEEIPGLSQYGLRGMRERAELIGAEFQVISKPQQGTTVRLSLPERREETIQ